MPRPKTKRKPKTKRGTAVHGGHGVHYSEGALGRKLQHLPRSAGREIVAKALLLRALLADPAVPGWVKAVAVGVLGYFILPVDAVPDFAPLAGYADDFAAMLLVLAELDGYVTSAMREEAEAAMPEMLEG